MTRWRWRLDHGDLGMVGYLKSKARGRIRRLLLLVVYLLRDDDVRLNGMRNQRVRSLHIVIARQIHVKNKQEQERNSRNLVRAS